MNACFLSSDDFFQNQVFFGCFFFQVNVFTVSVKEIRTESGNSILSADDFFQNQVVVFQVHACTVSVKEFRSGSRNSFFEYSQHLFWMRNKENSFTLHSLI